MSPESKPTRRVCSITDALSYEYLLTEAGRELQPILLALKERGDRFINPGAEPVVFHHTCGTDFHPLTVCAAFLEPLRDGELTVAGGTHPVDATHVTPAAGYYASAQGEDGSPC